MVTVMSARWLTRIIKITLTTQITLTKSKSTNTTKIFKNSVKSLLNWRNQLLRAKSEKDSRESMRAIGGNADTAIDFQNLKDETLTNPNP